MDKTNIKFKQTPNYTQKAMVEIYQSQGNNKSKTISIRLRATVNYNQQSIKVDKEEVEQAWASTLQAEFPQQQNKRNNIIFYPVPEATVCIRRSGKTLHKQQPYD